MKTDDLVLITDLRSNTSYLVKLGTGTQNVKGLGVLDFERVKTKNYGDVYEIGSMRFLLRRPTTHQAINRLKRKAQVITEKDIPNILFIGDVPNARLIIEGGAGSGYLTSALCSAIHPGGTVVTYELREDFASLARENLDLMGLSDRSVMKIADITKGIEETGVDLVVVDIPDPQACVPHAHKALRSGGVFISYVPTMNQMESCSHAMKEAGFLDIQSFETLYRRMVVGEMGTRPDFEMLGHTGYLTYGYK